MPADYVSDLERQAARNAGNRVYYGPDRDQQYAQDLYAAMNGMRTSPVAGAAPRVTDFMQVQAPQAVGQTGNTYRDSFGNVQISNQTTAWSRPSVQVDEAAYTSAATAWMRGQERYADWSDQEIAEFVRDTMGMSAEQRQAAEYWQANQVAWRRAGEDAEADRNDMLARLEAFRAGYSESWINDTLAREKAYWDAKGRETIREVQTKMAAIGRTASPYLLGFIGRQFAAQQADALQVRRMQLEQERSQHEQEYLTMLNSVYQNTQRNVVDPATAAQIAQQMGVAASDVRSV